MGNFNKRNNSSRGPKKFANKKFGGRSFGNGNKGRDDDDSRGGPTLYQATCHACRKECEVPFRPNGSKPVFCSICFDKQGAPERPRFEDKRKHEFERDMASAENKSAEQLKAQFAQVHAKLDKILQLLDTRGVNKTETDHSEEENEKAPFKMKKKVSSIKKSTKKK